MNVVFVVNSFRANVMIQDAVILVSTDTIMSIFGGITVFGTLGYLSHEVHLPVDKVVQSGEKCILKILSNQIPLQEQR